MAGLHYIFETVKPEGRYVHRVYSYDGTESSTGKILKKGSMAAHYTCLERTPPVYLKNTLLSFSPNATSKESELAIGQPQFDMKKLRLMPDAHFVKIIEAVRAGQEIWLEERLIQHVQDATTEPLEFFSPRKERLTFWGKLNNPESIGKIRRQAFTRLGRWAFLLRNRIFHTGELNLTFTHWINVRCAEPVKPWLDDLKTKFITEFTTPAIILQSLVEWISPTPLVAVAGVLFGTVSAPGKFNFKLRYKFEGAFDQLDKVIVRNKKAGKDTLPFINDPKGIPSGSFYAFGNLGVALVTLSREFFLKFEVELPTLKQAYDLGGERAAPQRNFEPDWKTNWLSVTRWLFAEVGETVHEIHVEPVEGTIEYTPAATWLSKLKVENPSFENLLPHPAYFESYTTEGGKDHSYKLVWRFVGQSIQNGALADDFRGIELLTQTLQPVRLVRLETEFGTFQFADWAQFHCWRLMGFWGGTSATLSFTAIGNGIEPFGASSKGAKPRKTFGTYDYGEFPLSRSYAFRAGLMPGVPNPEFPDREPSMHKFAVISTSREPGKNNQLKLLEIGKAPNPELPMFEPDPPVVPPDPPDPPQEPPHIPPKDTQPPAVVITAPLGLATVAGAVTVKVESEDWDSGTERVHLYIDGVLLDLRFQRHADGDYRFSWNSMQVADGMHTISATAFDRAGNSATTSIPVTVDNIP